MALREFAFSRRLAPDWSPPSRGASCDDGAMAEPDERAQRIVFGALLEAHPGPLSRSELATMLRDPVAATDAVDALVRDGVANLAGEMVFASRAATRADQLGL
jgi:hypothetical protein